MGNELIGNIESSLGENNMELARLETYYVVMRTGSWDWEEIWSYMVQLVPHSLG